MSYGGDEGEGGGQIRAETSCMRWDRTEDVRKRYTFLKLCLKNCLFYLSSSCMDLIDFIFVYKMQRKWILN